MTVLERRLKQYIDRRTEASAMRALVPAAPCGPVSQSRAGTTLINFSSNNYLGLSHHPEVIARTQHYAERYGAGSGASRLVSGTLELHEALEAKLAALKHTEAALLFGSGFQANSSILPVLFDRRFLGGPALVFADHLIHASLHQGCSSAGVRQIRFKHNDLNHLESMLRQRADEPGTRFIITESVFSMDGDQVDLAGLLALKTQYDAFLLLDEAHAVGVLGPQGMGLAAAYPGQVDLVLGTCGKALGSFGAYVACSRLLRDYLINACPGFIYSTALPPPVIGSIDAALDLLPQMDAERRHLLESAQRVRTAFNNAGIETGNSTTQIIPALVGEAAETVSTSKALLAHGILGVAIRPPTVPPGTGRIRFSLSAAHTEQQIDALIAATTTVFGSTANDR